MRDRVLTSQLGKTIVRNGLLAFALCQAWGNDPTRFAADVPGETGALVPGPHKQLLGRAYASRISAPGNVSPKALGEQIPAGPLPAGLDVLILVSSLTVLGPAMIDELLGPMLFRSFDLFHHGNQLEMPGLHPDAIEAWPYDPETLESLLKRLEPYRRVVILSGDVHFATAAALSYWKKGDPAPARFAQFTSSGMKILFKDEARFAAQSVRLVILGKLRAIFPTKEAPTARIQLDLVGEIDFERQRLFVHARLVDSKIAGFPRSGAAALLLVWDDSDPSLTLALGGVHPDYERRLPAGFPKLERLSVPISKGNNPKLRLELYFAVTSNSLQIGGKLEAAAGIGKFTIEGFLAVNALVEFPFRVQFDLKARVQLKAYGVNLFAVTLEGKLSGPRPWHARGKATFEIWIFDYSVSFDASIGSAESTPPLPAVNVGDILLTALRDVRNWTPRLARAEQNLVALRKIAPTSILLLHPVGTLGVTQSAVPLGVTIQRLGAARPRGEAKFEITHAEVGGSAQPRTPVTEQFARGQFFDLTTTRGSGRRVPSPVPAGTAGAAGTSGTSRAARAAAGPPAAGERAGHGLPPGGHPAPGRDPAAGVSHLLPAAPSGGHPPGHRRRPARSGDHRREPDSPPHLGAGRPGWRSARSRDGGAEVPAADVRGPARSLAGPPGPGARRGARQHRGASPDQSAVRRGLPGRAQPRDGARAALARLPHGPARLLLPPVLGRRRRRPDVHVRRGHPPIHTWVAARSLGQNATGGTAGRVVLLLRGEVFRRYPTAIV